MPFGILPSFRPAESLKVGSSCFLRVYGARHLELFLVGFGINVDKKTLTLYRLFICFVFLFLSLWRGLRNTNSMARRLCNLFRLKKKETVELKYFFMLKTFLRGQLHCPRILFHKNGYFYGATFCVFRAAPGVYRCNKSWAPQPPSRKGRRWDGSLQQFKYGTHELPGGFLLKQVA